MMRIKGSNFVDDEGRALMLRGVNLGGSSKIPYPSNSEKNIREGFFDHTDLSFVGRPFPLNEADEHYRRLREWGLTFLRFLITWEGIEHTGPDIYDEEYLDYIRAVVIKAREDGFAILIDPHQDVWSRFCGGDGAPGWTFETAGMDLTQFTQTGAAIVHALHGDPFPRMIWPTNGSKLASATMFTLFFGGNDFAPQVKVEGEPIQEYFQRHFLKAVRQVVERLKDLDNVIGYDTFNEPLAGYIGWKDLNQRNGLVNIGDSPTPYQTMLLGSGIPQEIDVWKVGRYGLKRTGSRHLDPGLARAWLPGRKCIWREQGVWDLDSRGNPHLLEAGYFASAHGRIVAFDQDYYYPFAQLFTQTVREVDPDAMIFIESEPSQYPPEWEPSLRQNLVFAPHWYDGMTLVSKTFRPYLAYDQRTSKLIWFSKNIRKAFAGQLEFLKRGSAERLGGAPVLLGEFGIPFDLDDKKAYRTGDFRHQVRAMDRSFRAVEDNLLHCTLWNYTPDNTNARGDQWNDEDLSIFSRDQQSDPQDINSGGRALEAAVRPYPIATAGEPLRLSFDLERRLFVYAYRHDPEVSAPTEIYVPNLQYPRGYQVEVSDGQFEIHKEQQKVLYWHTLDRPDHWLRIH